MIVSNKEEWKARNTLVELLLKEKYEKLESLKEEIFTLNFALEYWKQHPFKD